jgi:hypothetical protein
MIPDRALAPSSGQTHLRVRQKEFGEDQGLAQRARDANELRPPRQASAISWLPYCDPFVTNGGGRTRSTQVVSKSLVLPFDKNSSISLSRHSACVSPSVP